MQVMIDGNAVEVEPGTTLLEAIQGSGEKAALLVALGNLSLRQRDVKAAETAFKRAQTLDPKSSASPT